ncbi:MAG: 2-oxoacid:ferredoxin oxidoreductase subunit beta [Candidatus Marinimicrobia bacterium]|nr:2-oxoacid:ferredoxin oxidoreductase subunit beta [Candidatus Neomarinimicrobiota bacterium]MCF7827836.1 2-oxoacid:ferredoxin oxidoreductase subunit beta [Candidatus Neomarinimicrobiota bacterium]MCF7879409.1 2-oxoacid:ferredoxin oxidoreductase subunit beta [Candidatus Neomarinimicrobiota bacterium]
MAETQVAEDPKIQFEAKDYKSETRPIWCPGCGDYSVLASLYQAFAELNIPPHMIAVISGIGCSSRLPGYVATYGFNSVHGRILPIATGVKMANPEITVVGTGGDGDGFSIGMGHVPHAARRNVDMTYIVMDNEIYGLTKGQLSPTAHVGDVTKTSVYGSVERPVEPVDMMINVGASFVARANAGDPKQLGDLIVQAIQHKGFAFIDALSPCRTFRGLDQKKFINEHTFKVEEEEHDPSDKQKALAIAAREDGISTGLLYREERPTYDQLYDEVRERATKDPVPDVQDILQRYIP